MTEPTPTQPLNDGVLPASFYVDPPAAGGPRPCRYCHTMIAKPISRQKFCSTKCQRLAARARADAKGYYKPCPVRGCKRRGFCAKHYPHGHRARAKHWGVQYEPIVATQVYDRDNWKCGLCGLAVPKRLKWPDPMSVSLDHIVPMSRGGGHLWSNVQCSHLICNMRKHNRV